jgi:hypothetical protein
MFFAESLTAESLGLDVCGVEKMILLSMILPYSSSMFWVAAKPRHDFIMCIIDRSPTGCASATQTRIAAPARWGRRAYRFSNAWNKANRGFWQKYLVAEKWDCHNCEV